MKRAIVCLVGLLLVAPAALGQATTLRFEAAPRLALALPRVHDPQVALSATRGLTVLAIQELDSRAQMVALTSTDSGDTFGEPVAVSLPGTWVFGTGESGPSLATGSAGLCVAWHQARAGGGTDIMISGSESGASWSRPVRLTDRPGISHGYIALTSAPDGAFYAAWLDGREKPVGSLDVYLARSGDGGKTFGKNVRVGRRASPTCRPALTVTADGRLFVAWRTVGTNNVRDIALASSADGGQTFTEAAGPASDNWKPGTCPRSGPALAATGNTLHLAWYAEGGGLGSGVRWACADDGKSFAPPTLVSRGVLDANHPTLTASSAGRVHLTFQGRPDGGDGWRPVRAYVSEVTNWVTASRGPLAAPGVYSQVSYPTSSFDTTGRLWMLWTAGESVQLSRAREINAS